MTNTDNVSTSTARKGDGGLVARFWGFEELLGNSLIKLVYYIGLFLIVVGCLFMTIVGAFGLNGQGNILMLLIGPIGGLIGLVFWRFFCELALLAFLTYDRLGDIKDKLP